MCGICGYIGREDRDLVRTMMDLIVYRGPDHGGTYFDHQLAMGVRRLSIIDVQGGNQPIQNEDGTVRVVYNGEIYNFPELRAELEAGGHRFATRSDTEVIVHLYEDLGNNFPRRLEGMFAIALWDARERRLLLVRDQFGIKPLHFALHDHALYFASEIKCILAVPGFSRELDKQSMHFMLNLRYIPGSGTLFKGVQRLLPGQMMIWRDGEIKIQRYYSLPTRVDRGKSPEEWAEGIREHFQSAVKRHLISDVPLGVFLSGGMDSSSIVACMRRLNIPDIKTYTLAFNEPTDEIEDARFVARHFGTEHHDLRIDAEPLRKLPEIIWYMEEPKINQLQGFMVSQFASQHVKVVLSGMGGDELFAGYINNRYIHYSSLLGDHIPHILNPWLRIMGERVHALQTRLGGMAWDEYRRGIQMLLASGDRARYYLILRNAWDGSPRNFNLIYHPGFKTRDLVLTEEYFRPFFPNNGESFLAQALRVEFLTKMVDDFLVNEDRTSMANSLEARVPFLDRRFVEFCFSIPEEWKLRRNRLKYIFKEAMRPVLPPETLRKKKWGFAFNPYRQFQKDLRSTAERLLTRKRIDTQGIFQYDYLRRIMDHRPHQRMRWHYAYLWMVVGFQIWHRMFIEDWCSAKPSFDLEQYYDS